MKTRKILAYMQIILGTVLMFIGVMCLLSLETLKNTTSFIIIWPMTIIGLYVGYKLFTNGMDYIQRGYIIDRSEEAITKLTTKLEHDKEIKDIKMVKPWNIILESNKEMLEKHNDMISTLQMVQGQGNIESEEYVLWNGLQEVIAYHYECIGKLQESIERMEERMEGDAGDVKG